MILTTWLKKIPTSHTQVTEDHFQALRHFAINSGWTTFNAQVITITGTNGKGSTAAILESILLASGFKVGTFTSPHLLNFTERVKINGIPINEERLCQAFTLIESKKGNLPLTQFQYVTLAAFQLFQEVKLDVVIMEVGIGGRLDPVNILDADIAVITSVAMDHTAWLGEDREAIGYEKAGIFRFSKPVVCGDPYPPQSVIQQARALNCPFYCVGNDFIWREDASSWTWWNQHRSYEQLPYPSLLLQNAATALQVLAIFSKQPCAIAQGLTTVHLPGRLQYITASIEHILDVAHNPAAAEKLAETLLKKPCQGRTLVVAGMLEDKDRKNTLAALKGKVDHWYLGNLDGPRAGTAQALCDILTVEGETQLHSFTTVLDAYQNALANAHSGDRIVVFGSFRTVAEVMKSIF